MILIKQLGFKKWEGQHSGRMKFHTDKNLDGQSFHDVKGVKYWYDPEMEKQQKKWQDSVHRKIWAAPPSFGDSTTGTTFITSDGTTSITDESFAIHYMKSTGVVLTNTAIPSNFVEEETKKDNVG